VESDLIASAVQLGFGVALLITAFFTGRSIEKRHYRDIRRREVALRHLPAVTFRNPPKSWNATESGLVLGSVVISVDHFKRFLAGLRMLFGGRVKSYESLLDRARREALLRLKEDAAARGYTAILNVRLETTRMASSRRQGKSTAGVEVLAFGTGLRVEAQRA
jgi:uncharacterized protein YbjQ (UPF0145 family)